MAPMFGNFPTKSIDQGLAAGAQRAYKPKYDLARYRHLLAVQEARHLAVGHLLVRTTASTWLTPHSWGRPVRSPPSTRLCFMRSRTSCVARDMAQNNPMGPFGYRLLYIVIHKWRHFNEAQFWIAFNIHRSSPHMIWTNAEERVYQAVTGGMQETC